MDTASVHVDDLWPYVLTLLPKDLDEMAREHQALVRCRGVPDAAALLRMILAYGVTDLSLKDVAAWAYATGVAQVSGPALFYRVRDAESFLCALLARVLAEHIASPGARGLRLRIVDATVLTGPGARGTQWRAHVLADPDTGKFTRVQITDAHEGEGYGLHTIQPGDVVLGDRGYAHARGIGWVHDHQGYVVARANPHTIRLCTGDRTVLNPLAEKDKVPAVGLHSFAIVIPIPPVRRTRSHKRWPLSKAVAWIQARLLAARTRSGEIIWVLTTLPHDVASDEQVMDLYRIRWQVELLFKRLKSLLGLNRLPSRQGPTARSWLLARFLAAALTQELVQPSGRFSPWGYNLRDP